VACGHVYQRSHLHEQTSNTTSSLDWVLSLLGGLSGNVGFLSCCCSEALTCSLAALWNTHLCPSDLFAWFNDFNCTWIIWWMWVTFKSQRIGHWSQILHRSQVGLRSNNISSLRTRKRVLLGYGTSANIVESTLNSFYSVVSTSFLRTTANRPQDGPKFTVTTLADKFWCLVKL
jgi:hypothetical protein